MFWEQQDDWTDQDAENIVKFWNEGKSINEVVDLLGEPKRTPLGVWAKLQVL